MDERLTGMCAYCGAQPDTRDHVPSKVLLDAPYPQQLPVVGACKACNASFALDEQYVACFIECVTKGTAEKADLQRQNIKRILGDNPALRHRIESSQRKDEADNLLWGPEMDRFRKVVLKLARGHAAYELYAKLEETPEVSFAPLHVLSEEERAAFEHLTSREPNLWPEIGSRGFFRASGKSPDRFERCGDWIVVQPGRYRYAVSETGGIHVRMVLSEYLACESFWEE